uniref:Probable pectate lyase F n=5 Tax=Globodera rostochiensis TaxID=31243 RepID=A0A914IDS7_GLORO
MAKMLFVIISIVFAQIFQVHALCTFPSSTKTITVQATMNVASNTDYKYTTFVGGSGILNGACDVKNGKMKYLMVLKHGVTIKNAIINTPGLGIYCEGSCVLENIYYKKLCYHATGFGYKSTGTSYTYQVIGGAGQGSPDKYFTQSGRGTTIIKNFCAEGKYGKVWCSCGNCIDQMPRSVQISNTKIQGPGLAIISANSNYGDKISISGLTLYGQGSPNTLTKYICQSYNGLTTMATMQPNAKFRPTQSGTGTCSYSTSAIKIVN